MNSANIAVLVQEAVKFAIDGQLGTWGQKQQVRAFAYLIAKEVGGEAKDYLDGENETMQAITKLANASATRQQLESLSKQLVAAGKKPIIMVGTKAAKSNLFAGWDDSDEQTPNNAPE